MTEQKQEGGLRIKGLFNKKSTQNNPLISIITVVYNEQEHLEQTICSVINQTYDNLEYIIVDGGSTDGTLEIIKKYEDKIAYWISEKDNGIYDAMNKGLLAASGEIINMLNANDFYTYNDVIKDYITIFNENFECMWVYANAQIINPDGTNYTIGDINMIIRNNTLNRFSTLCHQAIFYKKILHEYAGLYNLKYKIASDLYFYLKIQSYKKHLPFFLDKITIMARKGGVSSCNGKVYETLREDKQIRDEIFGKSLLNEIMYLKKTIYRYLQTNETGMFILKLYYQLKAR